MEDFVAYLREISKKWRREWEKAHLHEADVDPERPKFFVTAAFPYPNSPMHLGHSRTYSITDAYARFKRMRGFNVLFPMGFHYTGTPIIAMSEKVKQAISILEDLGSPEEVIEKIWKIKEEKGVPISKAVEEYLREIGREDLLDSADALEYVVLFAKVFEIPYENVKKLTEPLSMANYFASLTEEGMKELGYMIDWRRKFTTIDPDFQKFITWQFYKLYELGYVERGTHPVAWDPVYNTPVSQHDTKGDVEPEIEEYDIILFKIKDEDLYLPAATLRAETVFGVTNVWVNPDATYKIVEVEGKKWILSEKAAYKIKFQKENTKEIGELKGSDILGKMVINPATGEEVPVLPASFVDPNIATGVVMSVPAHAPFDYVALKELEEDPEFGRIAKSIKPVQVIRVPGTDGPLAPTVVEKMGIRTTKEKEMLEEATKEVYSLEYRKGRLMEEALERVKGEARLVAALKALMAGEAVPQAREKTAKWLKLFGAGDSFYEIKNGPVYSRFGNEVVVKVLKDQWFLNYGDPQWKSLARRALAKMRIVPESFRKEFENTIEWLQKRACARTRGLGTPLPWDKRWIIESLSDSTIYMAFYTVDHILRSAGVPPERLEPEVWDYILLGKGDLREISQKYGIDEKILKAARESFEYWYPVDSRHSGKDLIKNHLTFFIFNHAAIFPEDKWPRQIVVNGFVNLEGKKMSKSLGNIIPISVAVKQHAPDIIRLVLLHSAELGTDADFRTEMVSRVVANLKEIKNIVELVKGVEVKKPGRLGLLDAWYLSAFVKDVENVTYLMESLRTREATNVLYFILLNRTKQYLQELDALGRGLDEVAKWVLKYVVERWVKMMAPFTPYFAEELWHGLGHKSFVVTEPWPSKDEELVDPIAEAAKEYVEKVIEDIKEIIKVAKISSPKKIRIEVAPKEQADYLKAAIDYVKKGKGLKEFMSDAVKLYGKKAAKDLKALYEMATGLSETLREAVESGRFDEVEALTELKAVIEREVGAPIEVKVYEGGKKKPLPLKPAIYVE
ncbi:MAG: leucine--tRNA ligase [Crenarchaeota archaeon]|nr:leucine--tRNA ligase [Thermoproteota archaeon]